MRITATWSADELFRFLAQLFPLDVRLGDAADRFVRLLPPEAFELVPGVGVQIRTRAELFWPLPMLDKGLPLPEVTAIAAPRIVDREGWTLVIGLRLEHVGLTGLPRAVEAAVSSTVSQALERAGVEVAWGYAETLAVDLRLPTSIAPPRSLKLRADEGIVRVGPDSVTIEAPLHLAFIRVP